MQIRFFSKLQTKIIFPATHLLLILFSFCCLVTKSYTQTSDSDKLSGLALVNLHKEAIGLSPSDTNFSVISSYIDQSAVGVRFVYLQETYKNIIIYNQIQSLAFKDGKLLGNSGSLPHFFKKVKDLNAVPNISPEQAIEAALTDRKLTKLQAAILTKTSENGFKFEFNTMGISSENITAELMWVPTEDQNAIRLAWQIYIVPLQSSDYWLVRIDAQNGNTLGVTNLTVYCNWGAPEETKHNEVENHNFPSFKNDFRHKKHQTASNNSELMTPPVIVDGATYLVIKHPAEAPSFAAESTHTNPWELGPSSNATTHKWHFDGTTNYSITRGNNVWAKEDRDNNNNTDGLPATSTTPDPLTFSFTPDYTLEPITANFQQFAITNLFYWNNLMHDMSYVYGFDEVAANFQADNMGRGGIGNDYVNADAQDGGGTNNANFSTPADGTKGRMQMYIWTAPTPDRDGDVDNGIICHEYGHGISHRLTGGPTNNAGCLDNAERGDEGWSDYFGLMMTTNWSTATINDGFNIERGIGTYALNQPTTGLGIRTYRYCTDMTKNPLTYANMGVAPYNAVHGIGEIWCSTIWDMTWDLIQVAGINPNLFNASGTGGNTIAMKLVIMGEKLQKCSPGFLDSRDAILQADQILYGGAYHCIIFKAFARRGMGFNAIQGSSGSLTDQTAGFSEEEVTLTLTQSTTAQAQLGNVTYTNTVKAFCLPLSNYTLRDTLPLNVTYVSGGTYDSGTRVVSFPVNLAIGATASYSFTVNINAGTYFPTTDLLVETVPTTMLPSTWTATSTNSGGNPLLWIASAAQSHSAPNAFFAQNIVTKTELRLTMNTNVALPASVPFISFWHNYNTETGWDGGVVEISTNGGSTWTDLGSSFSSNGYNGTLGSGSNLANRSAFTGNSNGWIKSIIRPRSFTGTNARLRFRFGSDTSTSGVGWYVDDVVISSIAVVDIKTVLFNGSANKAAIKDTFTRIVLPVINAGTTTGTIRACQGLASQNPYIQSFIASGTSLLSNIIVTAPSNFEVSLHSDNNYGPTVTLNQSGGLLANTTIYVRSSATASSGPISGNVTLTSGGANNVMVAVTGTISVTPDAVVNPSIQTSCSANVVNPILLSGSIVGTVFNWTRNNLALVTGMPASGTGDITGALTNLNVQTEMVTFTITPVADGCSGIPVSAAVSVRTYMSIADGDYNDPNTWSGGCVPPNPLPPGVNVTINHIVTRQ
ncbi:MAG: M36 family metallopeptidase [Saprospiraceae bacterium]|nr:M36 family metallopeptidase [Saprospiraceae bacterium]